VATRIDTVVLGAHQITLQLWLLFSFFIDGIAMATTILCAHYNGRGEVRNTLTTQKIALILGAFSGILIVLLYFLGQNLILGQFTYDEMIPRIG
jgi:Na+-driven multidrug efflux pump